MYTSTKGEAGEAACILVRRERQERPDTAATDTTFCYYMAVYMQNWGSMQQVAHSVCVSLPLLG